ncbi:hypothetical protein MEQU1_001834 [Malassezia equina]|uniref:Uncharacterized protein n=1 Tax=Malassezia equina TaxID=1381935 RepID=A0AAF0EEV5_9BASI|nr:hypothetical protein MEQU1_001834 [Malassezia equina]
MSRSKAAQDGHAVATVPESAVHIDAVRTEALADAVSASLAHVLREIGWLLVRRAQLAKEGRPVRECLPLLQPLAKACRTYYDTMEQLITQLLMAESVLEHLLDGTEPGPEATDAAAAQLAPLDLYNVMSTLPAMQWDSTTTGASAPNAEPNINDTTPTVAAASIDVALAQAMPMAEAPPSGRTASDAIAIDSDDSDNESAQVPRTSAPLGEAPRAAPDASASMAHQTDAPPSGDDLVSALLSTPLPSTSGAAEAATQPSGATVPSHPEGGPATDTMGDASALDFSWLDLEALGSAVDWRA